MKNWIYYLIAFLLAVDNVFVSKRIGFLSVDRLLEIMIFILFFRSFLDELRTNPFFKKFTQFLVGFIVLKFLMNLWFLANGEIKSLDIVREIFKGITFLIFAYLFVLVLKKGPKYLRVISWVHLGILIFALLHHPLSPIAGEVQEFKKALLTSNDAEMGEADLSNEETYIEYGLANRFRLSGPFAFAITFSYFAISSFILNLYLFMKTRKKFYLLVLGLLIVTAFLSQTRSLILGLFIISAGYFLLIQNKTVRYKFNLIAGAFFSILILMLAANSIGSIDSRVTSAEGTGGGSDNRPLLWATGILAVLENPFGVSEADYDKTRQAMFEVSGDSSLLHLTSHNGLINVGFQYTFFGYILFGFFAYFLIKSAMKLPRDYKFLFLLSLLGYLVHSSFHNNFILYADYPFLTILILIGYANVIEGKNEGNLASVGVGN
ncbi:O-antigen ligase family protein [Flagellimonas pelagia]|uniref:O-antigen ligase domain-containing protein n=1 Tax=Flagellimonas pelagia TaxID=2306998 RepID=A0A3A1NL08_9FLAO|nr:O-antigen ligase family protein [Allomuricauda maritima]RIV46049.1 O-antigen ligase domain-containing protein [Allomuricauda maritima]TXJ98818.1 O-antigen ligase family protein [Allomuricauda maritima]